MEQLQYWRRLLNESGFFSDIFRSIGWVLVKGLQIVTDLAEDLVDDVYSLLDFTSYAGVDKFFSQNELKILLTVLLSFAIMVLAWNLIFNIKEHKSKVLQQLAIMVIVVCGMPLIFSTLNQLTNDVRGFVQGGANQNVSNQIIAEGIVDLKYIDSQGFSNYTVDENIVTGNNGQSKNGFLGGNQGNVSYIDPNEKITEDSDINTPDILLKRIGTTETGNLVVEEIKTDKILGIDITNWYYRYYVDFLSIFLCLIASIIAYFFTAWKVAKIIFELAFHHLLAVFISASDLTTGQRIKTVFKSLGSIYVVLMLLPFLLKMYILGQTYVNANVSNGFVKGFVLIAMAFAVIDGPNIIERVLGIDAGIKSGFQTLATAFMLTKGATSVAKGAGKAVGTLGGAVAGAGAGSIKEGIESFRNQRNESKEGGIHDKMNNQSDQNSTMNESKNQRTDGVETQTEASQNKLSNDSGEVQNNGQDPNGGNGISAQMAAENQRNTLSDENASISSNAEEKTGDSSAGISDGVKKNMDKKGKTSPLDDSPKRRYQPNPHGIIGTTARSYNNGRIIGGAIGRGAGKIAGKMSNRVSPPKPKMENKETNNEE